MSERWPGAGMVMAYGAPSMPREDAVQPGQSSARDALKEALRQAPRIQVESREALVAKVMVLIAEALVPLTPEERRRVIQAYASRYGGPQ